MVADRFWGGIPAGAYSHRNLTFMATAEENHYIDTITVYAQIATLKTATVTIMGTRKGNSVAEALLEPVLCCISPTIIRLGIELEPGTICYALITPSDATLPVVLILSSIDSVVSGLRLPAFVSGAVSGTMDVLISTMIAGDTNQHVMETPVATNLITIPALQSTPAAADELELVSDSASDTQDVIIDYWDSDGVEHSTDAITMTGTTEVTGLAATYDDVWVVKQIRVAPGGDAAVGNILLTDASA